MKLADFVSFCLSGVEARVGIPVPPLSALSSLSFVLFCMSGVEYLFNLDCLIASALSRNRNHWNELKWLLSSAFNLEVI